MAKPVPKQTVQRLAADAKWAKVQLLLETTSRSLEDIGAEFGVSKGRVSQKMKEWKAQAWPGRGNLQDRVRARADAKVQAHESNVTAGTDEAVEVQAVLMANTILRERRDVERLLTVTHALLDEVEAHGQAAKRRRKRTTTGTKVEPVSHRIDAVRKLTDSMTKLIVLERTVLAITPDTPIDASKRVAEAVESGFAGLRAAFDKRLGKAAAS